MSNNFHIDVSNLKYRTMNKQVIATFFQHQLFYPTNRELENSEGTILD